jgi:protein-L-isoaspartate(D-aspartate) O-methyltransferase
MNMKKLTKSLQGAGVLKTSGIIRAFLENDRKKFVPAELAGEAYLDMPLPTAHAQTISQPYTVALMLELLQPGSGQKILDIGFGSGWTTAILANIVGQRGRVYGIEVVPEVFEFGKNNLSKMGYNNIALYQKSGWEGLPENPGLRGSRGGAEGAFGSAQTKRANGDPGGRELFLHSEAHSKIRQRQI